MAAETDTRGVAVKLAFACQRCGTRLLADATLSGRTGRCHKCGHRMVVPDAAALATSTVRRHADGTGAGKPSAQPAADRPAPARPVLADDDEPYRLADVEPTTPATRVPAERDLFEGYQGSAPVTAEEPEFVVTPPPARPAPAATGPSEVMRAYRSFFGLLVRGSSWVSEASYTVSFLILVVALAAGMIGNHGLTQLAMAAILGFNLVGIVGDVVNLMTLSFRKNPLQGALFLLPPCTLYYLVTDWPRYRETVGRMRIPLLMLGVVGAAYAFVPWLSGGTLDGATVESRLERAVTGIETAPSAAMHAAAEEAGSATRSFDAGLRWIRSLLGRRPAPDDPGRPTAPATPPASGGTSGPAP